MDRVLHKGALAAALIGSLLTRIQDHIKVKFSEQRMFTQRKLNLSVAAYFTPSFLLRFNTLIMIFTNLENCFVVILKYYELCFFISLFLFFLRITKSTGCKSTELIALDVGSLLRLGGKEVEVSRMFGFIF